MRCARSALLLVATLPAACQWYVQHTVLDTDMLADYERVFGCPVPSNVGVVRSMVVNYAWRPGVVTTDDWCFELLAPRAWIDLQLAELHLEPARAEELGLVPARDGGDLPAWYAPGPLESYEPYVLRLTSIPYVHMLVSSHPEPDGRYRVFTSKR